MAGLFTLTVYARNLLRKNRRRDFFFSFFVSMSDLGLISQHISYQTTAITDSYSIKIVVTELLINLGVYKPPIDYGLVYLVV